MSHKEKHQCNHWLISNYSVVRVMDCLLTIFSISLNIEHRKRMTRYTILLACIPPFQNIEILLQIMSQIKKIVFTLTFSLNAKHVQYLCNIRMSVCNLSFWLKKRCMYACIYKSFIIYLTFRKAERLNKKFLLKTNTYI